MAAPPPQDLDQEVKESRKRFKAFFDQDFGRNKYQEAILKLIEKGQERLELDIDDLRSYDSRLARRVITQPVDYLPQLHRALGDVVNNFDKNFAKDHPDLEVGLTGNFGEHHVTPRGLRADLLNTVVCLEGIVTKCFEKRSKVVKSVHYVPATGQQIERQYSDFTSLNGRKTTSVYPKTDDNKNPLVTEFGLCTYDDYQQVTLQEMPERAPAGQMPDSVDLILLKDLVGNLKPGDRVKVVGIYRSFPSKSQGHTSGIFRTALIANHCTRLIKVGNERDLSQEEIRKIKTVAADQGKNMFERLAQSIAPSICGYEYIKRAVLAQLLGGVEKNLENGTHLRGDINVLMVGDPSTAKSQMLRFVLNMAPLAIATTGRGSSGVGLTAAVLTDMDTGEKRLEAGAMVLADRGIVCIDEFDKMSDGDRVAIHEVMEQQTVTINKAAIHTTLNARCSVLAAANPVYGQYKPELTIMENVALPDSLLSRFDLLFIVLDNVDPENDRRVSEAVLRNHRYRAKNEPAGFVNPSFILGAEACVAGIVDEPDKIVDDINDIYVNDGRARTDAEKQFNLEFVKKYIQFAKKKFTPQLTDITREYIATQYVKLRAEKRPKSLPITARTLECIVRLSTAVARARLSLIVEKEDAKQAVSLLKYALYAEEPDLDDVDDLTFNNADEAREAATERTAKRQAKEEKRLKKVRRQQKRDELRRQGLPMSMASDLSDTDEDEGEYEGSGTEDDHDDDPSDGEGKAARPSKRMATSTASTPAPATKRSRASQREDPLPASLSEERRIEFMRLLRGLMDSQAGPLTLSDVHEHYSALGGSFTQQHIEAMIADMAEQGQIILLDGILHTV